MRQMTEVEFREEDHSYWVEGVRLPSVTTVLREMGFIDTQYFTEEGRMRGTLVHQLTELSDLGTLDEESVDPRFEGYLYAWREFSKKEGFIWTEIEKRNYHPTLRFAGTPDRVGICRRGIETTIDIKTGPPAEWHSYQLGGYLAMKWTTNALTVHLRADGTFRFQHYLPLSSHNDWTAIYQTYRLLQRGKKNDERISGPC